MNLDLYPFWKKKFQIWKSLITRSNPEIPYQNLLKLFIFTAVFLIAVCTTYFSSKYSELYPYCIYVLPTISWINALAY
jgi:hypothetical protein